ncbi:unnamed protein product [Prorocentrum cordatum]|uniref:Autophagy-related protein 9 n=1 Tax=Prorocentrum cordatum TaxID=2364126 RepID=A0ABN9WXT1_9DINO|nr:unnamed protein product [Polarella glacialis]
MKVVAAQAREGVGYLNMFARFSQSVRRLADGGRDDRAEAARQPGQCSSSVSYLARQRPLPLPRPRSRSSARERPLLHFPLVEIDPGSGFAKFGKLRRRLLVRTFFIALLLSRLLRTVYVFSL